MSEYVPSLSAVIAAFVFLFALFKWYSHVDAEREKLKAEAGEARHAEFTKILEEHKQEFKRMNACIESVEDELIKTRDELHRDYAKKDSVHSLRIELKDDFDKVFKRLSSISKDLNQLIGCINGNENGR